MEEKLATDYTDETDLIGHEKAQRKLATDFTDDTDFDLLISRITREILVL